MRNKGFAAQTVPMSTEIRAKVRQIYGQWVTPLTLIVLLGTPAALCAQKQQGQWSDLNRLKAGQGIEVVESNMKTHHGNYVTSTDESLVLQEAGTDVSIKQKDVVRVTTASTARRGEHVLVGLVVGGAIGAAVGAGLGSSGSKTGFLDFNTRGIAALVGIAIGAPSGALIGAVVPAHTTLYRAAPVVPHQTASP